MEEKGCGCIGFVMAVLAGVFLGLVGLSVAGWFWLDRKVLDREPLELVKKEWTAEDEARLAVKLAPAVESIEKGIEKDFSLSLSEREADRLMDLYVLEEPVEAELGLEKGDTALVVRFSSRVSGKRWVNGILRAEIKGREGDFETRVYQFVTGQVVWPRTLYPQVAQWVEGLIETQAPFKNEPWKLTAVDHGGEDIEVKIRIIPRAGDGRPSPP